MKRVLLIQDVISSYRVPVYNIISQYFDFSILYMSGKVPDGLKAPAIQHGSFHIGPLKFYKRGISRILRNYDVILYPLNVMESSIVWAILKSKLLHKRKFIPWGIGVPASYSVRFDDASKQKYVRLTKKLINISDAVIFYTDYPVEKYSKMGVDKAKLFVAHNTVEVLPLQGGRKKDSVLFVGTLYKAKSSINMLEYYKKAYLVNNSIPLLRIVGGGDEYEDLLQWIKDNRLEGKVVLEGPVFDEYKLRDFFESAYACVSLGQAGLSVQKSMGYGVPFITTQNAYTGGERLDIVNRENGLLLFKESDFEEVLLEIASNPDLYLEMGKKGYDFYMNNRTVQMMADSVISAINSVI